MIVEILAILGVILFNAICYVAHERSILHKRLGLPVLLFVSNRHEVFNSILALVTEQPQYQG